MCEPKIHSHISDCLPKGHKLSISSVYCDKCEEMLHCDAPGECMQTWFETGAGNFCFKCFIEKVSEKGSIGCLDGELALK